MAIKLDSIRENPKNPRFIRDEKFHKLVSSIKDFPKMMELRPLVIDGNNVVLGGNMRLKALRELGYTEISSAWVKNATEFTPKEIERFIIADNLPFGEWDSDALANYFDLDDLKEWGMEDIDLTGLDDNLPEEPRKPDEVEPKKCPNCGYELGGI